MDTVHLKIDGQDLTAQPSETILEAARKAGIHIPTLCFLKGIANTGSCRVCLVEVEKARTLLSACTTPVAEGMVVYTHSPRVLKGRRNSVELLISNHAMDCLHCIRDQNCELQQLAFTLGIRESHFQGEHTPPTYDDASCGIVRDTSKCVLCQRCIETCRKVQGLGILGLENRGFQTIVGPVFN